MSSMAAAAPGFIAGILILVLNVIYLNFAAKKEIAKGYTFEDAPGDEHPDENEKLPNPIVALIPMVLVFVLYNGVKIDVNFALMAGIILAVILMHQRVQESEYLCKIPGKRLYKCGNRILRRRCGSRVRICSSPDNCVCRSV